MGEHIRQTLSAQYQFLPVSQALLPDGNFKTDFLVPYSDIHFSTEIRTNSPSPALKRFLPSGLFLC